MIPPNLETYEPFISFFFPDYPMNPFSISYHLTNRFNQTAQLQSSKSFGHGGWSQVSQLSTVHVDNLFRIQCDILNIPSPTAFQLFLSEPLETLK